MPTLELNGKLFAEQSGTGPVKLKIDELTESTANAGIRLAHPLKSSAGDEILSPSGTVSNLSKLSLTPSAAPSNPVQGDMYLDSSDNKLKIYTGNFWTSIIDTTPNLIIDYLVVAGGGGGGEGHGGGGGAGGLLSDSLIINYNSINGYTIDVTIGAPGAARTSGTNNNGNPGSPSALGTITTVGGGYGGGYNSSGGFGGSGGGGGGAAGSNSGGAFTANQGYNGGDGSGVNNSAGGGGGGAGGPGNVGTSNSPYGKGGDGGLGINWLSLGNFYAGGGAAGSDNNDTGFGGSGVGGNGAGSGVVATNGAINTGSGGGGGSAGESGSLRYGAAGGKGVVIISYLSIFSPLSSIDISHVVNGGSAGVIVEDLSSRPGYRFYKFTDGTGNISW